MCCRPVSLFLICTAMIRTAMIRTVMLAAGLSVLGACSPSPQQPVIGVVAQVPNAGAVNVPLEANLTFEFAQAMNTQSVEQAINFEPTVLCDWSWSVNLTMATCNPKFDLQAGTQYKTILKATATTQKAEAINPLESVFTSIETREFIAFQTDLRVLRGTWSGVLHDYPSSGVKTTLKLNLTARYVDETRYEIRGVLEAGPLTLTSFGGPALGLNADRYLQTLASKPYAVLSGTNADRSGTWFLTCERLDVAKAVYSCGFRPSGLDGFVVELRRT
jgi:Bacterial Ig-like domain